MSLIYLMDEICAGVEIYYSGRQGGQYLKTAFILCDDYTELTAKLFLLTDDRNWSDRRPQDPNRFKNYHQILGDVEAVFTNKRTPDEQTHVREIHAGMSMRRNRRNDFFHSTTLLDLSVTHRMCVDAFCDLLDYGSLLLGNNWATTLQACRNLGTLEILLRLEKKGFNDPSILPKVNRIFQGLPRNQSSFPRRGVQATYPFEDLYYRMCVISGGRDLRDALVALL